MNYVLYPLFGIFLTINMFFLIGESITFWHFLFCVLVAGASHLCIKQTIKCWELALPPESYEYYYDILALNVVVALVDPITHKVWYKLHDNLGMCTGYCWFL